MKSGNTPPSEVWMLCLLLLPLFLIKMILSTPSTNVLCQCPQPCSACSLSSCTSLHPDLRPLLVSSQTQRLSSALPCSLFLGSGKLAIQQEVHALPAGDSNLVFLKDSLSSRRFLVDAGAPASVLHKLIRICHLCSLIPSCSPPAVLCCLVLVLVLFLYVLVHINSPGPSSWLLSLFPSLALIFSVIMPCWLTWPELGFWMQIL